MGDPKNVLFTNDISIVLAGAAGQGIQTIEHIVTRLMRKAGYNVFSTSEFMSRIRGGSNTTEIRVTEQKTAAYVDKIDILIPLDNAAIAHCKKRITSKTIILGDKETLTSGYPVVDLPLVKTANAVGGILFANSVAVGALAGLFGVSFIDVEQYLKSYFAGKSDDIIAKNIAAAKAGLAMGEQFVSLGTISIDIPKDELVDKEFFMTGAEAIAVGALAGGCDFVSSYPMSPSTNVLQVLAEHKNEFGIVVEQAEDEIAAINMALGAWYAGARGFVTTAGGGFALMCEGVSLAGMIETPVVVHVGQRPGPATGLPTRTEQADLELVLFAGHGEFPRAIFAPGTISEAILVTHKAFEVADKYQIPSFILTDQFFLDSNAASPACDISALTVEKQVVKTPADYRRYTLADNGVSPRGIPRYGDGIVCVDSDEHTEEGYITEDLDVRSSMMDKRLKKLNGVENDALQPTFIGNDSYETLVICWGSNLACVNEAVSSIGNDKIALLHFSQVYPLHASTKTYLQKAKKLVCVENNATGQFALLIKRLLGIEAHEHILKYNGAPFSVEELTAAIQAKEYSAKEPS